MHLSGTGGVGRIFVEYQSNLAESLCAMYTVIGIKPDGSECEPLEYATVEEAMKKLQDLIEADEWDLDNDLDEKLLGISSGRGGGPMFVRYTVIPHQAPREPRMRSDIDDLLDGMT